jgi:hypothetical protein
MKMLVLGSVLGLAFAFAVTASAAMTTANCTAFWKKADTNGDGKVSGEEAKMYTTAMTDAKMTPMDANMVSDAEFMKACEGGAFDKMSM